MMKYILLLLIGLSISGCTENKPDDAEKAKGLNRTETENKALAERLRVEIRQTFFAECFPETLQMLNLLKSIENPGIFYLFIGKLAEAKVRLSFIRNTYHKLRYPSGYWR